MLNWHQIIPGVILDVKYEYLVEDTEAVTRQVINYCNLDWEGDCLEFYNSKQQVKSSSSIQLRQPIYKTAVAK